MEPRWQGQALVIVPTYNECENIERLVSQLRRQRGDVHVLVVDDSSPDGTGEIVDRLAEEDDGVRVLHRAGKLGLGTAYRAGFKYGLAYGYAYLCTMDADFSHNPDSLPLLIDRADSGPEGGADLVVGSRYVPGGRVVGSTTMRRGVSRGANALAHMFLGVSIRDCTAGFRCYRRRVLETINLDQIFSSGYSFLIEMAFYCQRAGFSSAEVPITFLNRTEGRSKISRTEIFRAFYTLLRLRTGYLPWDRLTAYYHRRVMSNRP